MVRSNRFRRGATVSYNDDDGFGESPTENLAEIEVMEAVKDLRIIETKTSRNW